jgi:hypothetical protein
MPATVFTRFFFIFKPFRNVGFIMTKKFSPYLPGILLFVAALIIGLCTYKDYGIGWDEPIQLNSGTIAYNYVFHGDQQLFSYKDNIYGTGLEIPLVIMQKWLNLTDSRDIYLMRHLVTHVIFLLSVLAGYILVYRLFRNEFLASFAFIMLALAPRIYAHSFFNSKDVPFLSMFLFTFMLFQLAFEKDRKILFLLLGMSCGYATSIRVMGIMLAFFTLFFLFIDLWGNLKNAENKRRIYLNSVLFTIGFCFTLYINWPYLWKSPLQNFIASFSGLAHFNYDAEVLFGGTNVKTTNLPWTYFPTWFIITNPVLWLIFGCVGLVRLLLDVLKKPSQYLKNTPDRNFLLFLLCFWAPIIAVIGLNSVIYDDWRHLYFVYPPFVFIAIYMVHRIMQMLPSKFSMVVPAICAVQAAVIGLFMVKNFPFSQVYFNELVSHEKEYLRENYELEYWGCGFKQALDHLVTTDTAQTIHIACNYNAPLSNNIMMLPAAERKRIEIIPIPQISKADYFVTNFRGHPEDYPSKNIGYSVSVLNSTILCVYDLKKK